MTSFVSIIKKQMRILKVNDQKINNVRNKAFQYEKENNELEMVVCKKCIISIWFYYFEMTKEKEKGEKKRIEQKIERFNNELWILICIVFIDVFRERKEQE